ncbi:amino acid adenylation domain-containing protein [Cytobacillus purgationiresistens]|uniref:Amino acid adenylation domain-containing protein n=1 Tax=Cytobacillus purgationiresistens TaxID=863449 RepID=A0ABU0ANU7_9BACI|nr:amino acid adenylation domain-containing protein [Cytobacillus purgationiresistens]MDQ0272964.1 amino acid adenylation domain-containing protein [Cytobacillus purgationiresistens]
MNSFNDIITQFNRILKYNSGRIAVKYKNTHFTFQEIEDQSNQIAHYLISKGITSEHVIGMLLERSDKLIITMLGILKSGAAFLPLDQQFPSDRIKYMVMDSNATLIMTERREFNVSISLENTPLINLEDIGLKSFPTYRPPISIQPHDLAYIIYTSGTTGKPKGVLIEHKSLANLIDGVNKKVKLEKYKSILFLTSISFDIFIVETIVPLCYGLSIIIAHNAAFLNIRILNQLLKENNVDVIQVTPSRLRQLLNSPIDMDSLSIIKLILVGGEMLPKEIVRSLQKRSNCDIYNMYGPTETTVWSSVKKVSNAENITIGNPITNTSIVVLDEDYHQVDIGVPGEIYILGDGLSRGYVSKDETSKKFIRLPNGKRAYKTGDLGTLMQSHEIQVLGRLDDQVKIKGCTVNLSEVESILHEIDYIQEVVVIDKEDEYGNNQLLAFYTSSITITKEVKQYLAKKLPYYMIPKSFIKINKLPMTRNGKVSREELRREIK